MRHLLPLAALLFIYQGTQAAEYIQSENTVPASAEETRTSIGVALEEKKKERRKLLLDEQKTRLEDKPPWLRDAVLDFNLRGYDFKRVNRDENINEALALGGEFSFTSGKIANIATIGLSYYLSYGLHAPDGEGGTGLLGPNQEDLSVLGQAYLQLGDPNRIAARLYRQTMDLPYVNKDDSRMIPKTHEAYVLGSEGTGRDFIVGHISQIKLKDSEKFIPMSVAAGALGSSEGVTLAGAKFDLDNDAVIGGFTMYGWDTFSTTYLESTWAGPVMRKYGFKAGAQFTDQRSVGDELVGDFSTHAFGLNMAGSRHGVVAKLAYTQTDKGGEILSPWGGRPSYNSMMLQNFSRAGEKATSLGISWSGKKHGQVNWSGYTNIVKGWGAVDADTGESLSDVTEYDFTIDYKPKSGFARGLWLRLRGAYADFDDGTDRWNVRLVLNYSLNLL